MSKLFQFYKEDPDPMGHQLAKLALTTFGSWLTIKLIETAYNAHFGLGDKATDNMKDFNA